MFIRVNCWMCPSNLILMEARQTRLASPGYKVFFWQLSSGDWFVSRVANKHGEVVWLKCPRQHAPFVHKVLSLCNETKWVLKDCRAVARCNRGWNMCWVMFNRNCFLKIMSWRRCRRTTPKHQNVPQKKRNHHDCFTSVWQFEASRAILFLFQSQL